MELPVALTVSLPSVLRIVDFEIAPGDVVLVQVARDAAEIRAVFYVRLIARAAVFSRFDIQGEGPNTLGWTTLRMLAQSVMELLDVDELRIEGAPRTSGANPGRRPTPLVFR